ncbi:hypothetical protein AHiyo1_24520 [Arthrobacter sp. Hiyo1]|nr:hypothetical protein AHiyo1_24520 [Arthrobacter sp. Hiyo1]
MAQREDEGIHGEPSAVVEFDVEPSARWLARRTVRRASRQWMRRHGVASVEGDLHSGRNAVQQFLKSRTEIPSVKGTAGKVVGGEHGEFGPFLGAQALTADGLLLRPPLLKRAPGEGRRESLVLGNQCGVERLRVHEVEPGLIGLPDVPGTGGIGVHDVDVQGACVRFRRGPIGEQSLQHTGAAGTCPDQPNPDVLRFTHAQA